MNLNYLISKIIFLTKVVLAKTIIFNKKINIL